MPRDEAITTYIQGGSVYPKARWADREQVGYLIDGLAALGLLKLDEPRDPGAYVGGKWVPDAAAPVRQKYLVARNLDRAHDTAAALGWKKIKAVGEWETPEGDSVRYLGTLAGLRGIDVYLGYGWRSSPCVDEIDPEHNAIIKAVPLNLS